MTGSLIILLGVVLTVLTAGMNLMVMISFKIDKQLQTISNYFLFSLAVADAMIGLISIPFLTVYIVHGEWRLGYITCQFWLSTDYLMSNASVYNLLLISFDRYFSVTRPLSYRPRRTTKKALVSLAVPFSRTPTSTGTRELSEKGRGIQCGSIPQEAGFENSLSTYLLVLLAERLS